MADVELNIHLPNESPYHGSVASKLPFLRIPLEKKSKFLHNYGVFGVSILGWLFNCSRELCSTVSL